MLKKETRIVAWDDCAFRFGQKSVRVIGAVFRGGDFIDGVLSTTIKKDGTDSTEKLASAILNSRHHDQLSYVMTNGISFGGLNVLDIKKLNKETRLPVIAAIRKKPDRNEFITALKKFPDARARIAAVKNAGAINRWNGIYYQKSGLPKKECEQLLALTCTRAKIPEPLRVAHLIAGGLSRKAGRKSDDKQSGGGYESRGGA